MVKPVNTAGKTQRQVIAMVQSKVARKANRRKPGEAALKEIKKEQKSTKRSIPKSTFKSLVMSITESVLADREITQGRRSTKNSQGGSSTARPSTSGRSPSAATPKQSAKKAVQKQVKSEAKRPVKSERSAGRSPGKASAKSPVKKEVKRENAI